MVTIRATDEDVTVWTESGIVGQYPFGLTGSDLAYLLEEIGVEAEYVYDETARTTEEVTEKNG